MKSFLLILLPFLIGACAPNRQKAKRDYTQTANVDSLHQRIKSVREYIESGEFIDWIPESEANRSPKRRQIKDNLMKAAAYRFYQHCSQDTQGFIYCHLKSGSEINIAEKIFQKRLREMQETNEWIRKCQKDGKNYRIPNLDRYLNQLLQCQ